MKSAVIGIGAIGGGLLGAWMLKRVNERWLRIGVVVLGVLLTIGLFLRPALIAGLLVMFQLMFGMTLLQQWAVSGLQLFYVAFYAALLATAGWDYYSVDHWHRSKKGNP